MSAALDRLDKSLIKEYRTAVETVPDIVEEETPNISFLRTEGYNPTKAAERLAWYWKFRKDVFGERWLLRMTQTGTGALSLSDVQVVRTGYLLVFPSPAGPVLLLDSTRLQHALAGVLDRCVFYLLTICSDEFAQTKGGTLLNIVSSRKGPLKSMKQKQQQWEFVHKAMPFKFQRCVVVQSYEEGKQILLEFLAFQQSKLLGYSSGIHTDLVSKDSFANTLRSLLDQGFDRSHIPASLGGDFDYGMVPHWTRMRLSIEDAMGSAPPIRNVIPQQIIFSSTMKGNNNNASSSALVLVAKGRASQVNRKEYVRQRNASYARRSYNRKKLEFIVQQEKLGAMERTNAKLRAENQRLEALLAQAKSIIFASQQQEAGMLLGTSSAIIASPALSMGDSFPCSTPGTITDCESSHNFSCNSSVDTGSTGSRAFFMNQVVAPKQFGLQQNSEWHEQSQLRHLFMNEN